MEKFDSFASVVKSLTDEEIAHANSLDRLTMARSEVRGRELRVQYAPFDHVNRDAKIVIVGMTPGLFQARQALLAARDALRDGKSNLEAVRAAKVHASFSGEPMRGNLVEMLDLVGVAKWLQIESAAQLWSDKQHMVHFTSALRYPVFLDGANWSGTPDMVRTPLLREQLERHTGQELAVVSDPLIVPLGPKVSAAMLHIAQETGLSRERILDGLPHPSGANAERISFFLGKKRKEDCSAKTNTESISAARSKLTEKLNVT